MLVTIEMVYQIFKGVFDCVSKHLRVRQKYFYASYFQLFFSVFGNVCQGMMTPHSMLFLLLVLILVFTFFLGCCSLDQRQAGGGDC